MRFLLAFTIFSSIYFGMNYYALHRLGSFFHFKHSVLLWAIIFSIPFPLIEVIDRLFHSTPTRIAYYIASAVAGFIFLLFCAMLCLELINLFLPIFDYKLFGRIIIIFILGISIFSLINATQIHIKEITINNFGQKMRIVHLTDIHIGTVWNSGTLSKIVKQTNDLNPDLILITGDLIDGSGKLTPDIFIPLKDLKAPTFFSMGNHEQYAGTEKIKKLLQNTGITTLENKVIEFNGINIIGLNYSENEDFFTTAFSQLKYNKNLPTVFMNHAPVGYEIAKKNNVNLQLSGHTHNGQIFPFSLLVKMRFNKNIGLYQSDNFSLYISPGTGTWGPPMRLGSKNEIAVFDLN